MNKGQEKLSNAKKLWIQMRTSKWDFPDGVVQVGCGPIRGTAFFPGGYGLWLSEDSPTPDIPTGKIMIVGQDFNSVTKYREAVVNHTEVGTSDTWRELLLLYPCQVLFINVLKFILVF